MVNKTSITISEDLYHRIGYISLNWNLSENDTIIRLLKRAVLDVESGPFNAIDKYLDATLQRG